jgi:hypothetical protein
MYSPWLGLFDKIARADIYVYLDSVPMESSGYENRNKIKTAQGWQWLTVPVLRQGYQDRPISTIQINNDIPWQRKHRKSLEYAYSRAEYFSWTMNGLASIYEQKFDLLTALNAHQMLVFLAMLKIPTMFSWSAHTYEGKKSDLVLDMCLKHGATKYIFGAKGRDYADVESFKEHGIEVAFQEYQHPLYQQLHGKFLPNMSVVDLLMNVGPKSLEVLTCGNLIK